MVRNQVVCRYGVEDGWGAVAVQAESGRDDDERFLNPEVDADSDSSSKLLGSLEPWGELEREATARCHLQPNLL
jgi:hypothetical protein